MIHRFPLGLTVALGLLVALPTGGEARDRLDPDAIFSPNLSAPIQRRSQTVCTNQPGSVQTRQVCDGRGVCRNVTVQVPGRQVCRQVVR